VTQRACFFYKYARIEGRVAIRQHDYRSTEIAHALNSSVSFLVIIRRE
jgi:hypothetical protein